MLERRFLTMSCHGSQDETSAGSARARPRHGNWHMWLMLACCLAPLAAIAAIGVLGIPGSAVLSLAAVLLCPLMMVFMTSGMGRDHGSRAQEPPGDR
jgi:nitrate reductase NapE component